jgi:hypothetical protein
VQSVCLTISLEFAQAAEEVVKFATDPPLKKPGKLANSAWFKTQVTPGSPVVGKDGQEMRTLPVLCTKWQCGNVTLMSTPYTRPKPCSGNSLLHTSNIASVAMLLDKWQCYSLTRALNLPIRLANEFVTQEMPFLNHAANSIFFRTQATGLHAITISRGLSHIVSRAFGAGRHLATPG